MAYAIVRHKVLDIEVIIKRTLVFAGMFSFVFGVFISVAYLVGQLFGGGRLLSLAITSIIVVFAQRPIENFLRNITDKFLFQRKYAYERILKEASEGMRDAKNLKNLINTIVKYMLKYVRPEHVAVLIVDRIRQDYFITASRGRGKIDRTGWFRIKENSALIEWMKRIKAPVMKDDIIHMLESKDTKNQNAELMDKLGYMRMDMERLNASVCVPSFCKGELVGALVLGARLSGESYAQKDLELFTALANQAGSTIDDFLIKKEKDELFFDAMMFIVRVMEAKSPYTAGHVETTSRLTELLGDALKNAPEFNQIIDVSTKARYTGLLHDLGKLMISDAILNKPGKLTDEEWETMKQHPKYGVELVSRIRAVDQEILDGIMFHQERWDGTGYPYGLKGKQIPPLARISSIIDAYHAIISDRPYKKASSVPDALKEIIRCSGTQFDPKVVDAFMELYKDGKI